MDDNTITHDQVEGSIHHEFNKNGWHRLRVDGPIPGYSHCATASPWSSYRASAVLRIGDLVIVGISDYFTGNGERIVQFVCSSHRQAEIAAQTLSLF